MKQLRCPLLADCQLLFLLFMPPILGAAYMFFYYYPKRKCTIRFTFCLFKLWILELLELAQCRGTETLIEIKSSSTTKVLRCTIVFKPWGLHVWRQQQSDVTAKSARSPSSPHRHFKRSSINCPYLNIYIIASNWRITYFNFPEDTEPVV